MGKGRNYDNAKLNPAKRAMVPIEYVSATKTKPVAKPNLYFDWAMDDRDRQVVLIRMPPSVAAGSESLLNLVKPRAKSPIHKLDLPHEMFAFPSSCPNNPSLERERQLQS